MFNICEAIPANTTFKVYDKHFNCRCITCDIRVAGRFAELCGGWVEEA